MLTSLQEQNDDDNRSCDTLDLPYFRRTHIVDIRVRLPILATLDEIGFGFDPEGNDAEDAQDDLYKKERSDGARIGMNAPEFLGYRADESRDTDILSS